MKVVFFGTPVFAAHVLEYLLNNQIDVVAVISKPDRPKGRSAALVPTPVKLVAQSHQPPIVVYQPEKVSDPSFAYVLESYQADLFVVVAYGEIIKQHLLDMPRLGCINVHTSLLPKFRGAAPIQRCLIEGETKTGVTVMHMVKKMDAGAIIKQAIIPIDPDLTFGELEKDLCAVGQSALLEVLHGFESATITQREQDESEVTFAPKIELEDCEIQWELPSQKIHNLVRGVNPYPGAWCWVLVKDEKKRLKINKTRLHPELPAEQPGTIVNQQSTKGNLLIATGNGTIELIDVQLEGKKSMTSDELTRGISRSFINFQL